MVKMDGSTVYIGDRVFDLKHGWGDVIEVSNNGFSAAHGPKRIRYVGDGISSTNITTKNRTCYWHEPMIIAPTKGIDDWRANKELISSFFASLRKWSSSFPASLGD